MRYLASSSLLIVAVAAASAAQQSLSKQTLRDVRQGPDGLLYVLTAEDAGALLRIEPGSGQ